MRSTICLLCGWCRSFRSGSSTSFRYWSASDCRRMCLSPFLASFPARSSMLASAMGSATWSRSPIWRSWSRRACSFRSSGWRSLRWPRWDTSAGAPRKLHDTAAHSGSLHHRSRIPRLSVASGAAQTGAAVVLIERGLIMGKSAAVPLQADFVNNIVLPHFYLFAPIIYLVEVLTAVSLILGIFVGLWAMIGAFQIVNLWLGLYSAPGEWPWTYLFLLVLMLLFALHRYRRSLR